MVLQEVNEASPTSDEGFASTYDGPSSTSPSSSSASSGQVNIDLKDLPRPPPLFGYVLGYTDQFIGNRIKRGLDQAGQLLGRPVTQPEADALSQHLAGMTRTGAWGDTIGIGAGILRWRATQEALTFPRFLFFRGRAPENPMKFGPLQGPQARAAWNALRLAAYTSLGWAIGGILAGVYGAMTYTVKMSGDPRLTEVSEALRRRANSANNTGLPEARPQPQRTMPPFRPMQKQSDSDDMSPQSGSYTDTGLLSDAQMQARDRMQRPDPGRSPTADRETTFSMDKVTRQPRNFDQDDASPTASYGSTNGESTGGSAWDRIRQQSTNNMGANASGRSFEQRSQARGAQSQQDSFSFSSSDEEQQLARSEAQKDFDQRMERERQGKDFSDNSTSRWGR